MNAKSVFYLQLVLARGVGPKTAFAVLRLLNERGVDLASDVVDCSLLKKIGVSEVVVNSLFAVYSGAVELFGVIKEKNVRIMSCFDNDYPYKMRVVLRDSCPPLLFVKGNIELFKRPSVGFCGARNATERGLSVARDVSKILSTFGICVVSGYAKGVDVTAHEAALSSGGATIVVLAEGILSSRSKEFVDLYDNGSNLLFVSEFPPMLKWISHNAMKRNVTICSLSNSMIVVESGVSGGTFAAAQESMRLKRPLFVAEYSDLSDSTLGNIELINRGVNRISRNRRGLPNLDGVIRAVAYDRVRLGEQDVGFDKDAVLKSLHDYIT